MPPHESHSPPDDPRRGRRGRLLILVAVLLWSTSGVFAKSTLFDDWPVETRGLLFGFWRAGFAGLLLLPFARKTRFTPRLIPMTACFAVMNVSFLTALVMTSAANGIWLQATAPFWVFLFTAIFLRKPARRADWFLLVCCLLGIGVILFNQVAGADQTGIAMGLLSGVSYGGVLICLRWLRGENAAWLVAVNHLVAAAAVVPFIWWQQAWQTPTPSQLIVLAAFGLLQMGLPYVLVAHGLRSVTSWEASTIVLFEPVLMPVWVFLLHGEIPAASTIVGAAIIFTGLVVRAADRRE